MAGGKATLVAWSLVGDLPWMAVDATRLQAEGRAEGGRAVSWLEKEMARVKAHIAEQNLKIVKTPDDVDLALKGDPHVVLSVEGASFLDEGIGQLQAAYDMGIRHIQLVHYIRNKVGDFQTERPELSGLTDLGKKAVQECNRLGILVDLAHSTSEGVEQALAVSSVPMVWSHSSVTRTRKPEWTMPITQARQLSSRAGQVYRGQRWRGRPVGRPFRRRVDA